MKKLLVVLGLMIVGGGCRPSGGPSSESSLSGAPSAGISRDLALHRARTLTDVRYDLTFDIPQDAAMPIRGQARITLNRLPEAGPLVLDFEPAASQTHEKSVIEVRVGADGGRVGYRSSEHQGESGHLVIPEQALQVGENVVEIDFWAGDSSLNRREDFLYTLFVPDRAHHAFPCFDQPDLKARFTLTLETPADWRAVAVARLEERAAVPVSPASGERARWTFAESAPIPTYLVAFAAGEFLVETGERAGRTLRFLHRETDVEKVARNRDALFDLHEAALAWLEDYTAIEYPFGKLDFVLIPGFQYGGMEHPEAIFYRDASLFLDESATQSDYLGRASLIAHEVAHMWFGDLVTMPWFDDVWMKEVFANFMAAKIAQPSFPEINHELNFVLRHFPAAYEVDRSQGANPIRQQLGNLNEAGSLYGAIIYQKAPIVMRHLELLMGEEKMRDGLREYLAAHPYGNASWPDLIATLDPRTEIDLASWSQVWVGEAGRPDIRVELASGDGVITSLRAAQSDPWEQGRLWNQRLGLDLGGEGGVRRLEARLDQASAEVDGARGLKVPDYVLPAAPGYGNFVLDERSRAYLLSHLPTIEDPVCRGVAWLTLWDEMLEGRVAPETLFDTARSWLGQETETQLIERLLSDLSDLYWRYLPPTSRHERSTDLENQLWAGLEAAPAAGLKSSYFRGFRSVALGEDAIGLLTRVWHHKLEIPGLRLSEDDFMTLAFELAVREVPNSEGILEAQLERIENPDRKKRFEFVMPALSADASARGQFFEGLRQVENREQERWVLEGLGYLHHPLRAEASRVHVLPALEMLEEIQRTGDIFFPKRWLDAVLAGHGSTETAAIVRQFLADRPRYPVRLRGKLLQSADGLFRAASILGRLN